MDISTCAYNTLSPAVTFDLGGESRSTAHTEARALPIGSKDERQSAIAELNGQAALRPRHYIPVATLTAARVFRDCSLRLRSSLPERRACRTLMRQAAIKWRRGELMGD